MFRKLARRRQVTRLCRRWLFLPGKQERRLRAGARSGVDGTVVGYLVILYARWPVAFFDDSIVSPPLLPRMLTKPRTVCFCHPVAPIISASVTNFARFIIAMTSAFLLLRSASGLAAFLAGLAGFAVFLGLGALFFGLVAFFAGGGFG